MPSAKAFKTREYCKHCANDFPADKLTVLFVKLASATNWEIAETNGKYCDLCMPDIKELEKALKGPTVEFKTEAFVLSQIEGGHNQFREK